ncbi:MAG: glycosyltransferase [Pseudomonadota bacterium]
MNPPSPSNDLPRLVMFTPANTKSAIGRMAALVTRSLTAMGCCVTVVRTESAHLLDSRAHDFGAPVVRWDDHAKVRKHIDESDACVYQIGNNYEFHQGGVHWLVTHPGLVCLHDFFLGHLFHGWAQERLHQANAVLNAWYGEEAPGRFFGHPTGESFIEDTANNMPMTEWICSQAYAVITHSQFGADRVLISCPGPVRVVPLAYDTGSSQADSVARTSTPNTSNTLNLLTIGHINPNKRVESVIKAIGSSQSLRERIHYRLVGAIQQDVAKALDTLASQLGVKLTISGEVDDIELNNAIRDADVISCLRWPALEAASASAIEAMLHGKAVVVTDTGFYREIPDACAIKISFSNEALELKSIFEKLISDSTSLETTGASAKGWAQTTFTANNYAEQIVDSTISLNAARPEIVATLFFVNQMKKWNSSACRFKFQPTPLKTKHTGF